MSLSKLPLQLAAFFAAGESTAMTIEACWRVDEKGRPHIAFSVTNQGHQKLIVRDDKLPWKIDASAYYVFSWKDGLVMPHDRIYRISDPFDYSYTELTKDHGIKGQIDLSYHFDLRKDFSIDNLVVYWDYSFVHDEERTDIHKTFYLYRDDDRCKAPKHAG